jgi:hypothetical protein
MQPTAISEHAPAGRLWGQQVHLDQLRRRLGALQAGRGGTVLVAGPAGLGKTTLLDAAGAEARSRGMTVFRGAGDVAGRVIPFGPLLEALVSAPARRSTRPSCATSATPPTSGSG